MAIDLSAYPQPEIIETLDYEAILSEHVATFQDLWEIRRAANPDLPEYDVALLETDPVKIVLEAASYRDLMMRARINDAARANLVAFALNADLAHLAAFYGVEQLTGEDNISFRDRLLIEIRGRSTGGSFYWYQAAALRADVRIKAVVVYRERLFPVIHIAVLSKENGGIPDRAMLDAVTASVMSDRVRLVNDTIIVEAAVNATTDVEVDIWLLPNASTAIIDTLAAILRTAWTAESGVGFDLEPSWIEARLHVVGVKKVNCLLPLQAVIADPGVAIALGNIKLNFKGYDY